MTEQTLLADVEAFVIRTGIAESAFGRAAVNDWKFLRDLRAGRRVWPETEKKVRDYMAAADGAADLRVVICAECSRSCDDPAVQSCDDPGCPRLDRFDEATSAVAPVIANAPAAGRQKKAA